MKKGTYDVRMGDGELVPVTAWEFDLFGLDTLIVHKDVEYSNQWTVSEPRSGGTCLRLQKTRKGAIEESYRIFHQDRHFSQEEFEDLVQGVLNRFPDTPTKYLKEKQDASERSEAG